MYNNISGSRQLQGLAGLYGNKTVNSESQLPVQMKTTTECSYLEGEGLDSLGSLRQVVLYHSHDSRGRGVWGLHMPADSRQASSEAVLLTAVVTLIASYYLQRPGYIFGAA